MAAEREADGGRGAGREAVDRAVDALLRSHPPAGTPAGRFHGARFDAGLAWVGFPPGSGGLGVDPELQADVDARLGEAGAPPLEPLARHAYSMTGPTVARHGTPAQRARFLRPMYVGDEVWCQLFSEPGAGSDLAGLATRAVRDGDSWVVDGQKVWTTQADRAGWAMLLARTDPDVPKHRGLTFFLVDMDQPGVDVRPLRQMNGDAEFCEVYLTDVTVPDDQRLGAEGGGWAVAMTTLASERRGVAGALIEPDGAPAERAMRLWRAAARTGPAAEVARDRLVSLWIRHRIVGWLTGRPATSAAGGGPDRSGAAASIAKLAYTELNQEIHELTLDLLGPSGMLGGYDGADRGGVPARFLRSRANGIEGGTSEIMRNVLAERVLGLPADVRVDKHVPWRDVPRS